MPADEYDQDWVPGNAALRGAGRKDEDVSYNPEHRVRVDELPNRMRTYLGLADNDFDPVEFADELAAPGAAGDTIELLPVTAEQRAATAPRYGAPPRPDRLDGVPFLPARKENWSAGRQGYTDCWFILHCTDDQYSDKYPDNLGKYWGREVTKVSVHFGVSDTMTRQYVGMNDCAWQARNPGNLRGVGVELSGLSRWTRAEWLEHRPMIKRAAQLFVAVAKARGYGNPTGALLASGGLKNRSAGLTQHRDLTSTFGGTHTDLGPNFPMDVFTAEVKAALGGAQPTPPAPAPAKPPAPVTPPKETSPMANVKQDEWDQVLADSKRARSQLDAIDDVLRGGNGNAYKNAVLTRDLRQFAATNAAQLGALTELVRQALQGTTVDMAAVERAAYDAAQRAIADLAVK